MALYEQPYDPKHPVICFDERPCQLIGDAIIPIPIKPGIPKKEHYEYIRNGTCCVFLAFEPLVFRFQNNIAIFNTLYCNLISCHLSVNAQHASSVSR